MSFSKRRYSTPFTAVGRTEFPRVIEYLADSSSEMFSLFPVSQRDEDSRIWWMSKSTRYSTWCRPLHGYRLRALIISRREIEGKVEITHCIGNGKRKREETMTLARINDCAGISDCGGMIGPLSRRHRVSGRALRQLGSKKCSPQTLTNIRAPPLIRTGTPN